MNIIRMPCRLGNSYLVITKTGSILIDTGTPGCGLKIWKIIQEMQINLNMIFITHAHLDHFGSAAVLHQYTGAPVAIHQLDSQSMSAGRTSLGTCRGSGRIIKIILPFIERIKKPKPLNPHWVFKDGNTLDFLGIKAKVIHTPGHTPGSSSLLFENGNVFVGDLVSSNGTPHLQRYFAHDWLQLPESLHKLKDQNPIWIYPGHGQLAIPGDQINAL